MTDNPQGRRWNITINNPLKYGFTHDDYRETSPI